MWTRVDLHESVDYEIVYRRNGSVIIKISKEAMAKMEKIPDPITVTMQVRREPR